MKTISLIVVLFISLSGISQPNKNTLDSAVLDNNNLTNWSKGIATVRGWQNLKRDSVWSSFYSAGSTSKIHPGQFNIGIGNGTFENANEGQVKYSIHIGQRAGWKTLAATNNVFIGWEAGRENTYGSENVGISEDALRDNTRGYNNVAIGRGAMISNTTGSFNTATGYNSLQAILNGQGNTAYGQYALAWLGNGNNNTAFGSYALETNNPDITINNAIGIGNQAGIANTYSDVILIGTNVHTDKNGGINIGGVYKGNVFTGVAEVKSISISGRQVTIDDNYLYVKTSTGILKAIPLQDITATSRATTSAQTITTQSFPIYSTNGQLIGFGTIKLNSINKQ